MPNEQRPKSSLFTVARAISDVAGGYGVSWWSVHPRPGLRAHLSCHVVRATPRSYPSRAMQGPSILLRNIEPEMRDNG